MTVQIKLEFTPNPDTLKYSVGRVLLPRGAANFTSVEDTEDAPLAKRMFGIQGVSGVMIGKDFVTITVADQALMGGIHQGVLRELSAHLQADEPIVSAAFSSSGHAGAESDIERQIVEILDTQIRPAVAMDGGDIVFDRFENGVVYLQMKGSCHGCPSSLLTLKQGIETRLKQSVAGVLEVQAV